jgi:hypothetical protein
VGYQMLAGRLPFEATSAHQLLYQHVFEPPPPLETVAPHVPPDLRAALARALEKQPEQRFASLEEFAAAVWPERARDEGLAAPSAAPPRPRPARKPGRKAAIAAVSLASAAVAGFVLWQFRPQQRESIAAAPPAADTPRTEASDRATLPAPDTTRVVAAGDPARPATGTPQRAAEQTPPRTSEPPRSVGWLTLDADPYGTVSIDGVDIGDTPIIRRELAPGRHVIRVTRDGHQPWSETLTIVSGNVASRRITLVPTP